METQPTRKTSRTSKTRSAASPIRPQRRNSPSFALLKYLTTRKPTVTPTRAIPTGRCALFIAPQIDNAGLLAEYRQGTPECKQEDGGGLWLPPEVCSSNRLSKVLQKIVPVVILSLFALHSRTALSELP